jgi:hypothetical protein
LGERPALEHLNTLGVAFYRTEQWHDTIDVLQRSIKLGFDRPYNWLFLAMAHWRLDEKDQAQHWYDKSLAFQTANPGQLAADAELRDFYAEAAKLISAGGEEEAKPNDKTEPSDAGPDQDAGRQAFSERTPNWTDEVDHEPEVVEASPPQTTGPEAIIAE